MGNTLRAERHGVLESGDIHGEIGGLEFPEVTIKSNGMRGPTRDRHHADPEPLHLQISYLLVPLIPHRAIEGYQLIHSERILSILSLPPSAICEYRSNRALLDAAATFPSNHPPAPSGEGKSYPSNRSEEQRYNRQQPQSGGQGDGEDKEEAGGRGRFGGGGRGGRGYEARNGWGGVGRGREVRE